MQLSETMYLTSLLNRPKGRSEIFMRRGQDECGEMKSVADQKHRVRKSNYRIAMIKVVVS